MLRCREQRNRGALLNDLAAVHDHDPVGDVASANYVVRYVEDRDAIVVAQSGDEPEDIEPN